MSNIAKCARCGREFGDAGPDPSGRTSCPFCGQPFTASVVARVAPATAPQSTPTDPAVPAAANRAIPVAVARFGSNPPNDSVSPGMAPPTPAPADTGTDPASACGQAPVVARVVAPSVPVVARVAPILAQTVSPLGEGEASQPDPTLPQTTSQEPNASPPGPVDPLGESSQRAGESQHAMGESHVSADIFGGHAPAGDAAIGASPNAAEQTDADAPGQAGSLSQAELPSQEVGPPEPTAAEITQAQEAEIAQAQEVETARVREAVKPFALTTAGLADQAPSNSPPPFPESGEENREIAGEVVEEPAVGLELTVDRAELSAEAMETFTESTEVLAVEPVGDAVEAVATFETQEEQSPLPEPLVRFEGIVAAEVAVTVFPAGLPGGAASSEEAGGEPGMFGFTPVRAGSGLAPTARAEGFVPRPSARYPRRRRQSGGIAGIVGVMLSGLLGMFLVYYAFNWLGGPRYDFLKFPLPGLRHTYKHLNRYRSLPRFGIDPDASFAVPKNGEPAAAKNGSRRKAETTQALEPVDEVEPVAEAELVEEIVPARKRPRVKKASAPAKPNGGRAKKAADDIAPFDIPEPDFSPAAPAAKKASPPAKPKDQPAKKAADDQPFDMPAPDPADSLPKLDFSTPGST